MAAFTSSFFSIFLGKPLTSPLGGLASSQTSSPGLRRQRLPSQCQDVITSLPFGLDVGWAVFRGCEPGFGRPRVDSGLSSDGLLILFTV